MDGTTRFQIFGAKLPEGCTPKNDLARRVVQTLRKNKRARECERRSQTGTKKNRWQEARGKCVFKVSPEDTDHPKVFSDAQEKSQHGYSGTRSAIAQNGGGTTTSKQMDHEAEKNMCLSSITARHTNSSLTKKRCKFHKRLGHKEKTTKQGEEWCSIGEK